MSRGASCCRGVVFDLDGTLLDSMPFVLEGLARAVAPYRPRPNVQEVMDRLGGPSDACIRRLLGGEAHVPEALAAYLQFLAEHEDQARLFPGATALLGDLRGAGVKLGLWTGRERGATEARLRAVALTGVFAPMVCGDDLTSHKPDPEGLRLIAAQWGLAPDAMLFVGDSDQDLEGARAAAVPMVAIQHDRPLPPALRDYPVAAVATPAEAYARVRAAALGKSG
jgi:HAD superfamily hydrolase (TIGR01549 family)